VESIYESIAIILMLCFLPVFVYIANLKSEINVLKKTLQMWQDGARELNEDFKKAIAKKKP